MTVPELRIKAANPAPVRPERPYVLYWMTSARRTQDNFGLDRAVDEARRLKKGLVVLEALRVGYRWASDRHHLFVLQGMADNQRALAAAGVTHHSYVEPQAGEGKGLVEALASQAALVVTDDFPCFFLPKMIGAVAGRLDVRLEQVDSNGLLPMRATERTFHRAFDFRRYLQGNLPNHLGHAPRPEGLRGLDLPRVELPAEVLRRWPAAEPGLLAGEPNTLARLPIDHAVGRAPFSGGAVAAQRRWRSFLERDLSLYGEGRNHPDDDRSSGLSPYLHFGHLSAHRIFRELTEAEGWGRERLKAKGSGEKEGWWGMSSGAESFIDELVTWRELGFNFSSRVPAYDQYRSLPEWARATLEAHRADPRPQLYSAKQLEEARTHDEIWNAAQRQLVQDGRLHNYLRMLWGKKILEWSKTPEEAAAVMIELNNKYAVDGRDPNSYSGIFWVLGRFDRAWGPERPIYGQIRYMSSDNTAKKIHLKQYLLRYGAQPQLL